MATNLLKPTPIYDNPYEAAYNIVRGNSMFRQEDWDAFAKRGQMDSYITLMEESSNLPADFDKKWNFDLLDTDTRFSAMYNELHGDRIDLEKRSETFFNEKTGQEDTKEWESTEYDYINYLLQERLNYEQEKILRRQAEERKENMNGFVKFLASTTSVLVVEPVMGIMDITQDLISLVEGVNDGFASMYSGGTFGDGFRSAFVSRERGGTSDWRFMDNLGWRDNLLQFEKDYTSIRDLDGNYTTVGKYLGGVTYSLGKALPTIAINLISSGAAGAGTAIAANMAKASTILYYTGMGSGEFREMANNPAFASVPTYQLALNAGVKTVVEYLIQRGVSQAFGPTQLDKLMWGETLRSSVKIGAKAALTRIAKDFIAEGTEEFLQQYSNWIVDRFFSIASEEFGSNSTWNAQTAFDAFILGGLSTIGGNLMSVSKSVISDAMGKSDVDFGKNIFASWEYKNTVRTFASDYVSIVKNKSLSDADRQQALGQMYATMRTIADVYGEIGEERFVAAQQMLEKMEEYEKKDIKAQAKILMSQFEGMRLDVKDSSRLQELLEKAEITETVKIIDGKQSIDEALADMTDEEKTQITETVKNVRRTNPEKKIVMTKDGIDVVSFNDVIFIPMKYATVDNGTDVSKRLAEQKLFETVASEPRFQSILSTIKGIYETASGETNADMTKIVEHLFFNDSFFRIVLASANREVYQFLSHLDVIEKNVIPKSLQDNIYKKRIRDAKKNMSIALTQYIVLQQNANYNDLTMLTKPQIEFIKKHRYGKDLANRIMKSEKLDTDDISLLKARINSMPASADVKVDIQKGLGYNENWEQTQSIQQTRIIKLYELDRAYKNQFLSPYDGVTYLTQSKLNNVFNEFLFEQGYNLQNFLDTDRIPQEIQKQIEDDFGEFNRENLLKYCQSRFEQKTGNNLTFNYKVDGVTVLEKSPTEMKGYETYKEKRVDIKTAKDIGQERTLINVVSGRGRLNTYINKNISSAARGYLTLTDVINEPELLTSDIQRKIEMTYGELTAENAFLYLRDKSLDDTGTISIVVRADGSYTFVDVRPMIDVLISPNIDLSNIPAEGVKIDKFVKPEFLTSDRLRDIIVVVLSDATYYDAKNNTIVLARTAMNKSNVYRRFALLHEFQHAIQAENNLNGGLSQNWLQNSKLSYKEIQTLVDDVKAHKPKLFTDNMSLVLQKDIVSKFVYDTSGESQAMGTEGSEIIDFYPTIVQHTNAGTKITMPWGTKYQLHNSVSALAGLETEQDTSQLFDEITEDVGPIGIDLEDIEKIIVNRDAKNKINGYVIIDRNIIESVQRKPGDESKGIGSKLLKQAENFIFQTYDTIMLQPWGDIGLVNYYKRNGYEWEDEIAKSEGGYMIKQKPSDFVSQMSLETDEGDFDEERFIYEIKHLSSKLSYLLFNKEPKNAQFPSGREIINDTEEKIIDDIVNERKKSVQTLSVILPLSSIIKDFAKKNNINIQFNEESVRIADNSFLENIGLERFDEPKIKKQRFKVKKSITSEQNGLVIDGVKVLDRSFYSEYKKIHDEFMEQQYNPETNQQKIRSKLDIGEYTLAVLSSEEESVFGKHKVLDKAWKSFPEEIYYWVHGGQQKLTREDIINSITPDVKDKMLRAAHYLLAPNISYEKFLTLDIPYIRVQDTVFGTRNSKDKNFASAYLGVNPDTSYEFKGPLVVGTVKPVDLIGFIPSDEYEALLDMNTLRKGEHFSEKFSMRNIQSLETPKQPGEKRTRVTQKKVQEYPVLKAFKGKLLSNDLQDLAINADLGLVSDPLLDIIHDGTMNYRTIATIIREDANINDYTFKLINKYIYQNEYIKSKQHLDQLTNVDASYYYALREVLKSQDALDLLIEQMNHTEFMQLVKNLEETPAFKKRVDNIREAFEYDRGKQLEINTGSMRVAFMRDFDGSIEQAGAIAKLARNAAIAGVEASAKSIKGTVSLYSNTAGRVLDATDVFEQVLSKQSRRQKELMIMQYRLELLYDKRPDVTNKEKQTFVERTQTKMDKASDSDIDQYLIEHRLAEIFNKANEVTEDIDSKHTPKVVRALDSIQTNIKRLARNAVRDLSDKEFNNLPESVKSLFDDKKKLKQSVHDTRKLLDKEASERATQAAGKPQQVWKQTGVNREQLLELEITLKKLASDARTGMYKNKTKAQILKDAEKWKKKHQTEKSRRIKAEANVSAKVVERVVVLGNHEFDVRSETDIPSVLKRVLNTTFDEFSKAETKFLTGISELKTSIEQLNDKKGLTLNDKDIDTLVDRLTHKLIKGKTEPAEQDFIDALRNEKADGRFNTLTDDDARTIYNFFDVNVKDKIKNGDRNVKMNLEKFYQVNDTNLAALSQEDVNSIIEYYSTSMIGLTQAGRDAIRRYYAYELYVLTYILEQGRYNRFQLTTEQINKINETIEMLTSLGGTINAVWRSTMNKIDPNKTIMQSIERSSGVILRDEDLNAISDAMKTGKIDDVIEAQNKMLRNALIDNKGKKRSIWNKLWSFQRLAMLSGPGTWARNHISNALLTLGDATSGIIGKLFSPKTLKKGQYKIIGTKVSAETKNFIKSNIINNGFLDSIMDGLSKYDTRRIRSTGKTDVDIATDMLARAVQQKVLHNGNFFGNNKFNKAASTIPKFIEKMLSDDPWIKVRTKSYFGKMLTEDNVDLTKGTSKQVLETLAEAYIAACFDYMRKTNWLSRIDSVVKEKGGDAAYFAYKQLMPFASASWNWFKEGLKYTPIGLAKAIVDYARLENTIDKLEIAKAKGEDVTSPRFAQYLAKRNIGKGIIGSIGLGIGILLGAMGIASIDEEDDKLKLRVGDVHVDISGIFGTQSIMLGMMITNPRKGNWEKYMIDVLETLAFDSIMSDFFNTFRYSKSVGQFLLEQPNRSLGMFLPNFFKTFTSLLYNHQIEYTSGQLGKFQRTFVQAIPGLAYAMPKKYDPYTGEVQTRFKIPFVIDAINRLSPIGLSDANMSDAEKEAVSNEVKKGELTGDYDDIGKLSDKDKGKLNKKYGELNAVSLKELQSGSKKYRVQNENGKYVDLLYSQMTTEQKKRVTERIMSENAFYAKVFIYTNNGGKYYASSNEYKMLQSLGIKTNVYKETKKLQGFI